MRVPVFLGLGIGLLFAMAAVADGTAAIVSVGLFCGIVGLAAVIAFRRHQVPDFLFLGVIALISVPADKYFLYRLHVGGWPGLRLAAADIPLLLLAAIVLLGWGSGRFRNVAPGRVIVAGAALLSLYLVSLVLTAERALAAFEIAATLHAFAIAFLVAAFFRRKHLGPVIAIIGVSLLVHIAFAGAQVVTGRAVGQGLLGGRADIFAETLQGGSTRLRPSGLFVHPIVFANSLMLGIPVIAAGVAIVRQRMSRWVLIGILIAGVAGIAATLSRGAWLSFAFAMGVFLTVAVIRGVIGRELLKRVVVWSSMAGLVAAAAIGPTIYERFALSEPGALDVRFELNDIAMRMIADHPFIGIGLNSFVPDMHGYDPKNVMEYFPATVHNIYLLEAAEVGIPGLIAFVALFAVLIQTSWKRLRAVEDRELVWFALALLAGLAGFLLSQLADFSHRIEPLRTILWAYIGLLLGTLRVAEARLAAHVAEVQS